MNFPPPPPLLPPKLPIPAPACPAAKPAPAAKRINVRAKGQRGEREVVDILQGIVTEIRQSYRLAPVLVQRNQNQSWQGGPDLHGLDGFAIEVKYQEQDWNNAWWIQTVEQGEKFKGVPILFYRRNGAKWQVKMRVYVNTPRDMDQIEMDVTVNLEDFISWFTDAYKERCELEFRA